MSREREAEEKRRAEMRKRMNMIQTAACQNRNNH